MFPRSNAGRNRLTVAVRVIWIDTLPPNLIKMPSKRAKGKSLDIRALQQELRQFAAERDWEQFHTPKNLAIALSVEASELLEVFQWLDDAPLTSEQAGQVRQEIADVQIYLARLADVLAIDIPSAVADKLKINRSKYPADRVRGSARKYTDYSDEPK